MFNKIGAQIKIWAIVIFIVTIIECVVGAIILFAIAEDGLMILLGFLALLLAYPIAWFPSALLYGFGELIDKAANCATYLLFLNNKISLSEFYEQMKKFSVSSKPNTITDGEETEQPATRETMIG